MKKQQYRITYAKAVYGKEEVQAVVKVLKSHATMAGPNVRAFEEGVAKLFGEKFGIMVNSGSSANMIACRLLSLPEGSEIITPVLTFSTTIAPFIQNRVVPAFVDVKEGTYQIDVERIEEMITKKTKALVIPSLLGNLPDFPRLRAIAQKHKLHFLEDSCDTLGGTFNGKPTGWFSDISTTSFYGSHIITAAGNGGMVCVNDKEWNLRARILRGWGRTSSIIESEDIKERYSQRVDGKPYDAKFIFEEVGYNFLPNELEAAFGLAQLQKLQAFRKTRQKNFQTLKTYFQRYAEIFILPEELPGANTAWLAFPLTIREGTPFSRYEMVAYLERNGVQTRPVFTGNVLRHPAFKSIPAKRNKKGYPVADHVMQNAFLIGCHHGMDSAQIDYLKELFEKFLKQKGVKPNE